MIKVFRAIDNVPSTHEYIWYDGDGSGYGDSKNIVDNGNYELIGHAENDEIAWNIAKSDRDFKGRNTIKVKRF